MRRGPRQHRLSSDLRPARVTEETRGIYGVVLKLKYPCCEGLCRLRTVDDIPKEVYERKCPKCGTEWTITRTLIQEFVRMDKIEWETPEVELYAKNRKSLLATKAAI